MAGNPRVCLSVLDPIRGRGNPSEFVVSVRLRRVP